MTARALKLTFLVRFRDDHAEDYIDVGDYGTRFGNWGAFAQQSGLGDAAAELIEPCGWVDDTDPRKETRCKSG